MIARWVITNVDAGDRRKGWLIPRRASRGTYEDWPIPSLRSMKLACACLASLLHADLTKYAASYREVVGPSIALASLLVQSSRRSSILVATSRRDGIGPRQVGRRTDDKIARRGWEASGLEEGRSAVARERGLRAVARWCKTPRSVVLSTGLVSRR
ncbi:MAG: hypothetical protein AUH69_13200 [Actinobacteria bacterium 13_1_40CM_4_65_12]|nr:MAG: hypothetical protein AUH69_13200 [Actinobacteria bacterium 13_1_40CM_4_65_12]